MAAPTASGFAERVLGTVNSKVMPTMADQVFDGNVLGQRLFVGGVKPWTGGAQMTKSVLIQKSTKGGSFSGLDQFNRQAQDNTIRMAFDVKGVEEPIVIPGIERSVNENSQAQAVSLVSEKVEEAMMNLKENLSTMVYGDGTGNSSKDLNGLDAVTDDGSNVANYGGQSRTTYPALNGNLSTSVGNLTLAHMRTQYDNTASTGASKTRPTLIVTDEAGFGYYEDLMTPTVRYDMPNVPMMQLFASGPARPAGEHGMNQGFNALAYRGVPVVADEQCPSGELFFLNENDLKFYSLDGVELESIAQGITVFDNGAYSESPKNSVIQLKPWHPSDDQYGWAADLMVLGNIVAWEPRRHAHSTGITGS